MIASIFVDVACDLARGRFWTASRLEETCVTVALWRKIAQLVWSLPTLPVVLSSFVRGTHVNVTLTIERESLMRVEKVPSSRSLLSHTGMCGVMPVPTSQPRNLPVPYAVSATSPVGFQAPRSLRCARSSSWSPGPRRRCGAGVASTSTTIACSMSIR